MADEEGGGKPGGKGSNIPAGEVAESIVEKLQQSAKSSEVLNEELGDIAKKLNQIFGTSAQIGSTFEETAASIKQQNVFNAEALRLQQQALSIEKQILTQKLRTAEGPEKESIKNKLKQIDSQEKQNDLIQEEESHSRNVLKNSLGISDSKLSLIGKMQEINKMGKLQLTDEEKKEYRAKMYASVVSNITEKAAALAQAIFNTSVEIDNAAKNLMKTAGFSFQEASNGLLAASGNAAIAGLSLEAVGQSMTSLKTNFSGFTSLTEAQRQEMTSLTATMDKMGLSAATTATFFDTATKSMGLSRNQSQNFITSLKSFADQTGLSLQQLDKDLASNMKNIANYGAQGTQVFKEMAIASKQLGIEMGTLFGVTEQLTTFQGAAESAAKFNAILGGDFLNSINLLNAAMESPVDVFREFKTSMDQAGVSFDSLDNGMKRTIADAAGMSVLDAGKLFSQDLNTATRAMQEQAKEQEELNKIAAEMTGIMDKLKSSFLALYPALQPMIEAIKEGGDKFSEFMLDVQEYLEDNPDFVATLGDVALAFTAIVGALAVIGPPLLAIYSAFMALKVLFLPITFAMGLFGSATATAGAAGAGAAPGIIAAGTAMGTAGAAAAPAIPFILALGAAFFMIGAGIGLAALGLAEVARAFGEAGTNGLQAMAAIVGITIVLAILAYNLMTISPAIGMIGLLAAAFIGLGVAMALFGDDFLVIKDMFVEINKFNTSAVNVIANLNSITDAVVEKYGNLARHFQSMATSAGIIGEIANLVGAPTVAGDVGGTFDVVGPNATIESVKPTEITINLKIDSDVKIDGDKIGKFIKEETTKIIHKSSR